MAKAKKNNIDPITLRLRSVIEKHSLNEVARRTETAPACVHRYANGSKIPAEFCGRLVREFQVNPSWLLTGEGVSDLSGIASSHSDMASELLDMVQAMNAVAHMRIGALAGKHHEKVLRELNDALRRYEDLRGRIGVHAKPIYDDLAGQLEKVMGKLDLDTADDLMRAADQVERLCFDDAVSVKHLALKARISILRKQFDKAHEYQRRLFRMPLADAALDDNEFCINAMRLVITLENKADYANALRVSQAALLLSEGNEAKLNDFPMLATNTGHLLIQDGQLFKGLQLMQRWIGRIKEEPRRISMRHKLMIALLFTGALSPEAAFDWGQRTQIKAFEMLQVAMLRREPELLAMAIEYYNSADTPKHKVYDHRLYTIMYAEAILAALQGDKQRASSLHDAASKTTRSMARPVLSALFHHSMGDKKKHKASVNKAIKSQRALAAKSLPLLFAAIHHHNVIDSGIKNPETSEFVHRHSDYILFSFNDIEKA